MTVRKNFNFDENVAAHLEEMAEAEGKTQTRLIRDMTEERYKKMQIKRKLEILDEIQDSFHGLLTNMDAKASKIEHAMEKYGN